MLQTLFPREYARCESCVRFAAEENDTHLSTKLETLVGILRTFEHKVYSQAKALISILQRSDMIALLKFKGRFRSLFKGL